MSTTTSDKNTATVLNNGPVYYTEITGSAFEHVINDDGSEYKFNPAWKCTGFADSTNSRIPKRDPNYVFNTTLLQDLLIFLLYGPLAYRPDGLRQDECGDAGSKSFELARFGPDPQQ